MRLLKARPEGPESCRMPASLGCAAQSVLEEAGCWGPPVPSDTSVTTHSGPSPVTAFYLEEFQPMIPLKIFLTQGERLRNDCEPFLGCT